MEPSRASAMTEPRPPAQAAADEAAKRGRRVVVGAADEVRAAPRRAWEEEEEDVGEERGHEATMRDKMERLSEAFSPVLTLPLLPNKAREDADKPPDYICDVLLALLCCFPAGALALWHSNKVGVAIQSHSQSWELVPVTPRFALLFQVHRCYSNGDVGGASESSCLALRYSQVAVRVGVVVHTTLALLGLSLTLLLLFFAIDSRVLGW